MADHFGLTSNGKARKKESLPCLRGRIRTSETPKANMGSQVPHELRQDQLPGAVLVAALARGDHRSASEPLEGADARNGAEGAGDRYEPPGKPG